MPKQNQHAIETTKTFAFLKFAPENWIEALSDVDAFLNLSRIWINENHVRMMPKCQTKINMPSKQLRRLNLKFAPENLIEALSDFDFDFRLLPLRQRRESWWKVKLCNARTRVVKKHGFLSQVQAVSDFDFRLLPLRKGKES